jgi:hypothetical protein
MKLHWANLTSIGAAMAAILIAELLMALFLHGYDPFNKILLMSFITAAFLFLVVYREEK